MHELISFGCRRALCEWQSGTTGAGTSLTARWRYELPPAWLAAARSPECGMNQVDRRMLDYLVGLDTELRELVEGGLPPRLMLLQQVANACCNMHRWQLLCAPRCHAASGAARRY